MSYKNEIRRFRIFRKRYHSFTKIIISEKLMGLNVGMTEKSSPHSLALKHRKCCTITIKHTYEVNSTSKFSVFSYSYLKIYYLIFLWGFTNQYSLFKQLFPLNILGSLNITTLKMPRKVSRKKSFFILLIILAW